MDENSVESECDNKLKRCERCLCEFITKKTLIQHLRRKKECISVESTRERKEILEELVTKKVLITNINSNNMNNVNSLNNIHIEGDVIINDFLLIESGYARFIKNPKERLNKIQESIAGKLYGYIDYIGCNYFNNKYEEGNNIRMSDNKFEYYSKGNWKETEEDVIIKTINIKSEEEFSRAISDMQYRKGSLKKEDYEMLCEYMKSVGTPIGWTLSKVMGDKFIGKDVSNEKKEVLLELLKDYIRYNCVKNK
jgi:hypothetical protein